MEAEKSVMEVKSFAKETPRGGSKVKLYKKEGENFHSFFPFENSKFAIFRNKIGNCGIFENPDSPGQTRSANTTNLYWKLAENSTTIPTNTTTTPDETPVSWEKMHEIIENSEKGRR